MKTKVQISTNYLTNHLFLPPQLPQEKDWTPSCHIELLKFIQSSIDGFILFVQNGTAERTDDVPSVWDVLRCMVDRMASTRHISEGSADLDAEILTNTLLNMTINSALCLHVVAQNAGVILRKISEEQITFEVFQASPPAANVSSTIGKLVMTFPSMPRVAFPNDKRCVAALCRTLAWLDRTPMPEAMAKSKKAGSEVNEDREVVDIHYLSQMLGSILATATTSNLEDIQNSTVYVTKRINDHALWKNADLPWRRMPEWLILRVALQTTLKMFGVDENSQFGYKAFVTYLLARLLKEACSSNIGHELLHVMNVKIANRMWKLRETVCQGLVFDFIFQQVKQCRRILQKEWNNILDEEKLPLPFSSPSMHEIMDAQHFIFPGSKDYLSRLYTRHSALDDEASFDPVVFEQKNPPPKVLSSIGKSPPEHLVEAPGSHGFWLGVIDFERWIVGEMRHKWQEDTPSPSDQLEVLSSYLKEFFQFVNAMKNPELFSRLYLVILELWVALDQAAIRICPLLGKYSPEIEISSFESLLLPHASQMKRLYHVEQYFMKRHNQAQCLPSLFTFESQETEGTFAYKYYLTSQHLQSLQAKIEQKAQRDRNNKLQQWTKLRKQYEKLTSQSSQLSHSMYVNRWGVTYHDTKRCSKCDLEKEASSLKIDVFEWSLPTENPILACIVVFELSPPNWFVAWRNITHDLCRIKNESPITDSNRLSVELHEYLPLKQYSTVKAGAITIASYNAKPWYNTHYSKISIGDATLESDVIKPHPLQYRMYDLTRQKWIIAFPPISMRTDCTPSLPQGAYSSLSWALRSADHNSNMVIAKQSECHRSLSYHEWGSFGHVRAGGRLQWRNILIEIVKGVGSFKDPAWFLLLRQAAWQVEILGEGSNQYRDFHRDLVDNSFATEALEVLSEYHNSIRENWQEGWTAMSLVMLTCRIHSLNSDASVRAIALSLLSSFRRTCQSWLKDVRKCYLQTNVKTDPKAKNDLLFRLIQIAVCCRSTFAIEVADLGVLFSEDPAAIENFMVCSIIIQDFLPESLGDLPSTLRYIVEKDVVQAAEVFFRLMHQDGLVDFLGFKGAVMFYWDGFLPDSKTMNVINRTWIRCRTAALRANDQARFVHYNVLDGRLLIDGKTLGNLPKSILGNILYNRVFPNQFTVEIVPSTLKGMSYQLVHNVNRTLEVHFQEAEDLIIRIRDNENNGATSEFVENTNLLGDFPNSVLKDSIILYNDATDSKANSLAFYKTSSAGWHPEYSIKLWEMEFSGNPVLQNPGPTLISAQKDSQVLSSKKFGVLNPNSHLVNCLFLILRRLESSPLDLYAFREFDGDVVSQCETFSLIVELPQYSLTFFLNSSLRLECKELTNMVISNTQTVGTLVGLRNQLILEHSQYPTVMKILVPFGDICRNRDDEQARETCYVRPYISDNHIKFFVYEVDSVLQRLTSSETLSSLYFLIYLHAMTSCHMSDPFTGRRGTEQALWVLKSSGSFAFSEPLDDKERGILRKIQDISPKRGYYPEHLTSMESITWRSDIPILSQCDLFVPLVDAVLKHNEDIKIFLDPSDIRSSNRYKTQNSDLRQRSLMRTSRFTSEFTHMPVEDEDHIHEAPMINSDLKSNQERLIQIATAVKHWTPTQKPLQLYPLFGSFDQFMIQFDLDLGIVNEDLFSYSPALAKSPVNVWFGLFYECCRIDVKVEHFYDILFTFSIMAYRFELVMDVLRLLLTMATQAAVHGPRFEQISRSAQFPTCEDFVVSEGYEISRNQLHGLVKFCDYSHCVLGLSREWNETDESYQYRCAKSYKQSCDEQRVMLLNFVMESSTLSLPVIPSPPQHTHFSLIDLASFDSAMKIKIGSWKRNLILLNYCTRLDEQFKQIALSTSIDYGLVTWSPEPGWPCSKPLPRFHVHDLLSVIKSRPLDNRDPLNDRSESVVSGAAFPTRVLMENLKNLANSQNLLNLYCEHLSECIDALEPCGVSLDSLRRKLGPETLAERVLSNAGLWPVIHPIPLLRQLTYPLRNGLGECSAGWLSMITNFAENLKRNQSKNRKEQGRDSSEGVSGPQWPQDNRTAIEYLDWLLLELDADISIRPVQLNVAKQMMSPPGDGNAVMQLNMGEGKSSVIIPMVATALANGKQLVRVMVLKPLSSQVFQLLRQRVCGLINRRVYFLPFHRNVKLDAGKIKRIFELFRECAENAAILICQPEHILSFRLIGLEALCSSKESQSLLEIQRWLDDNSRDILDESDELLSTRYQLIYTIGTQLPLVGQPDRWEITQKVFSLVHKVLPKLKSEHRLGLEVSDSAGVGEFPRLRILTEECAQGLVNQLAEEIMYNEGLQWLRLRTYTQQNRKDAFYFITNPTIDETRYVNVKLVSPNNFPHLLLLRGLLALGIVVNVLKEKRWRVDYGLDLDRCLVAVPYRAKDYPSVRAEFGHPEVIISLTCLSYYYGGLRNEELVKVFEILLQLDNPDLHYQDWIKDGVDDIPIHLRSLRGLNLEDAQQQREFIFPRLRHIKSVIDFYLGHEVFPREAKEFPYKLTTNSWDLAMRKTHVTTGFSGTNDHRYVLPLTIKQNDSPDLKHTNALVLEYILRPENRGVVQTGANPSAKRLLEFVVESGSQILIDAGAQVLELNNTEVAREWLKLETRKSIEAAIYCDFKDETFKVVSRTGRIEILQNSSYKAQLEKTLIYLDEARTRGTDLKFPLTLFAVVTLGPKLGKDKLVQACTRMRQLGRGHSVVFFASEEIVKKIQELSPNVNALDSSHVLLWSMYETIIQLKNSLQHWGIQGLNYSGRQKAWQDFLELGSFPDLLETIREKEARTLEALYGLRSNDVHTNNIYFQEIESRLHFYGINSTTNNIAEEQERELAHEKEEERQTERVSNVTPLKHALDPALSAFLDTERPVIDDFKTLADSLEHTSSASILKQISSPFFRSSEIRCTKDFMKTIVLSSLHDSKGAMNDFLRPVQWIMTSTAAPNFFCIISPFEANEVFHRVRCSRTLQLHPYTSRVSRQGKSTDSLDRFLLSRTEGGASWTAMMMQELNIFSGQLFFRSEEAFNLTCRMLGLHLGITPPDVDGEIGITGFVKDPGFRSKLGMIECKFDLDPVSFLQDLVSWRCKGQGYAMTHIWKILHGRIVEACEF